MIFQRGGFEEITRGDKEEDQPDDKTQAGVNKEGGCGGRISDKCSESDDEEIAEGAGKEPETRDEAFQIFPSGSVGVLESGGADENFREGEDEVGNTLPENGELVTGVEGKLDSCDTDIGDAGKYDTTAHATQWSCPLTDAGINKQSHNRYENHDDERIETLHFFGAEGKVHLG